MSIRSIKSIILIAVLMLSFSCGKTKDQEVKDEVLSANIYLSTKQCQPAIDVLESMGRQTSNALYLKTLASAYACRAEYSSVVLFGTDIEKTASPAPLGGMSTYTTSTVASTSPLTDDLKFRDLQTAIDILLYAGGIPLTSEPSAALRATKFSANHAGDINTQIAFMMMVQAGKFMKVYGNANAAGVKSLGGGSNTCFTSYANVDNGVSTAILASGSTGNCSGINSGHPQLIGPAADPERKKRLCEGVVLFNGILDLLPSIIASAGGTALGNVGVQIDIINQARQDLEDDYPDIGTIMNTLSQTNCENDASITEEIIELYYLAYVEALIE